MRRVKDGVVVELKLRPEWKLVNDSRPYYDFEDVLLTMPSLEKGWEDEQDHIISQITIEQDEDLTFAAASLTVIRNVPHGDHKELFNVNLDIDEALYRVFEI